MNGQAEILNCENRITKAYLKIKAKILCSRKWTRGEVGTMEVKKNIGLILHECVDENDHILAEIDQ